MGNNPGTIGGTIGQHSGNIQANEHTGKHTGDNKQANNLLQCLQFASPPSRARTYCTLTILHYAMQALADIDHVLLQSNTGRVHEHRETLLETLPGGKSVFLCSRDRISRLPQRIERVPLVYGMMQHDADAHLGDVVIEFPVVLDAAKRVINPFGWVPFLSFVAWKFERFSPPNFFDCDQASS